MNKRSVEAHIRRFDKLISVFESAKPVKKSGRVIGHTFEISAKKVLFDISYWHRKINEHYDNFPELCAAISCGTAACVAGTAGLIPEFRKAGFRSGTDDDTVYLVDKEGYSTNFSAFATFFGITLDESQQICNPSRYHDMGGPVTPTRVLVKLRAARKKKIAELNSL